MIEAKLCLWKQLVPEVEREVGRDGAQCGYEVVLECSDGTFCFQRSMLSRRAILYRYVIL